MTDAADLFGVLNLNKPAGMTSRDVVNVVQRLVRPAKCGHAGTLDPMATGVLLVCLGPATRLISMLQEATKTYVAEFMLGQRSDTDDSTGHVTHSDTACPQPDAAAVRQCLQKMVGDISQVPPTFSAVHVDGQRAYRLAREGQEFELAAKSVRIDRIEVIDYEWPKLTLEVECGSGTYVRSIARDLGEQLGCGGLMSGLVRTRIGGFELATAVSPDELSRDSIGQAVHPARAIVSHLPTLKCSTMDRKSIICGKQLVIAPESVQNRSLCGDGQIALIDAETDELLGLAEQDDSRTRLQPRIVFVRE